MPNKSTFASIVKYHIAAYSSACACVHLQLVRQELADALSDADARAVLLIRQNVAAATPIEPVENFHFHT